MARNAIESDFRSSKMGVGGGASQWPACKPFGDIHSICAWANTPILVIILIDNLYAGGHSNWGGGGSQS